MDNFLDIGTWVRYYIHIIMNKKEKRELAIAYEAIQGRLSWSQAAKKLKVTRVHERICSLLRKEYQESIKYEE